MHETTNKNRVLIEVTITPTVPVEGMEDVQIIYRYWDERKNYNPGEFDEPNLVEDICKHWANDGDVVIPDVEQIAKVIGKGDYKGTAKIVRYE